MTPFFRPRRSRNTRPAEGLQLLGGTLLAAPQAVLAGVFACNGFRNLTGAEGQPGPHCRPISGRPADLRFPRKFPEIREFGFRDFGDTSQGEAYNFLAAGFRHRSRPFRRRPRPKTESGIWRPRWAGPGPDFGGDLLTSGPISGRPADLRFPRKISGNPGIRILIFRRHLVGWGLQLRGGEFLASPSAVLAGVSADSGPRI